MPKIYLDKARIIRDSILKNALPDALLHGDLHHDNILQNGDEFIAIDPKGVIGSPSYEVCKFIINPEDDIPFITKYFGFNQQDVFDWYFVHLILAHIWNLEDNIESDNFINLVEKTYKFLS